MRFLQTPPPAPEPEPVTLAECGERQRSARRLEWLARVQMLNADVTAMQMRDARRRSELDEAFERLADLDLADLQSGLGAGARCIYRTFYAPSMDSDDGEEEDDEEEVSLTEDMCNGVRLMGRIRDTLWACEAVWPASSSEEEEAAS